MFGHIKALQIVAYFTETELYKVRVYLDDDTEVWCFLLEEDLNKYIRSMND